MSDNMENPNDENLGTNTSSPKGNNVLSLPISIIISGFIIAGSIIFTNSNRAVIDQANRQAEANDNGVPTVSVNLDVVREVSKEDHIRGDADAEVVIIEYSDLECPYCASAHQTLKTILNEYDGQVAWVYRHLPLTDVARNFHVNAVRAAEASECVNELEGNDTFWSFVDGVFSSGMTLTDENVLKLGSSLGVDSEELLSCMNSGKYTERVQDDIANSHQAGGYGTPWFVVVGPDDLNLKIEGAQPISAFRQVIDQMLAQ